MSRETMRQVLTATLTEVGVAVTPGATTESLVAAAATWIVAHNRTLDELHRKQVGWHAAVRGALIRAGRDPGAHALLDDMLAELVAVADGRLVR